MAEPTTASAAAPAVESPKRSVNWIVLGCVIGLALAMVVAVTVAFRFVESERARELQAWQIRLGIVADSRSAAINEWLDQNFGTLRELTENASLQLYVTELDEAGGDRSAVTDEAAQTQYLRNLLIATGERTGFKPPVAAAEISANVQRSGIAGLALLDKTGKLIVATPEMPPPTGPIRTAIAKALNGDPAIVDVYRGATNLPTMGFALPILGVQADTGSQGIGVVVGIRIIGRDVYDRLKQPGATEETAETYLVRKAGNQVEFLSPLADGTPPLERALNFDIETAYGTAVDKPGTFAIGLGYKGERVLVASRPITDLPWVLVRSISWDEAMAGNENRLNTILGVFVAIIVIVTVVIIAVWRHGTSVRMAETAEKFRVSSERFENISKFMRVVTNSAPNIIVAVDGTTTYTFANEPAAKQAKIPVESILGKTMADVVGPVKAKALAEINKAVLAEFAGYEDEKLDDSRERAKKSHVHTFGDDDDVEVIKSDHVPLRGDRDHPPGVLMVLSDLTDLTRERRRSEKMLRQLINTLVSVVDRRDPYSAHHSTRVAEVATSIAKEMGLSDLEAKTCDVAGSLLSLGKIFIPTELLARGATDLKPDERVMVASSHIVSADLLRDVTFDGPVVETIRQSAENWDGSGPLGLKGDQILLTARVVAVAQMFVRRITARSYREGMSFEDAMNNLLADTGKRFDRRAVSALVNYLENRDGMTRWASFRNRPSATRH